MMIAQSFGLGGQRGKALGNFRLIMSMYPKILTLGLAFKTASVECNRPSTWDSKAMLKKKIIIKTRGDPD